MFGNSRQIELVMAGTNSSATGEPGAIQASGLLIHSNLISYRLCAGRLHALLHRGDPKYFTRQGWILA